ncbi:hypothetical protein SGLAM104S_03026 [Streptomyces glaucescens]
MDTTEMRRLFEAHRAAEAARDIDGILRTFVSDCFLETKALGLRSQGTDAVRAAYQQQYFTAFPDLAPEDEGIGAGPPWSAPGTASAAAGRPGRGRGPRARCRTRSCEPPSSTQQLDARIAVVEGAQHVRQQAGAQARGGAEPDPAAAAAAPAPAPRAAPVSASARIRRASGSSASPASVSVMLPRARMNRSAPSSRSSALICWDSEGWRRAPARRPG